MHVALHDVGVAQGRPPGHAIGMPVARQRSIASQVGAGVSVLPVQLAAPQDIPVRLDHRVTSSAGRHSSHGFAGLIVPAAWQSPMIRQPAVSGLLHASRASSQESEVQTSPSSQLRGIPPPHVPAASQVSPTVQKTPSLQAPPAATVDHAVVERAGSQI